MRFLIILSLTCLSVGTVQADRQSDLKQLNHYLTTEFTTIRTSASNHFNNGFISGNRYKVFSPSRSRSSSGHRALRRSSSTSSMNNSDALNRIIR